MVRGGSLPACNEQLTTGIGRSVLLELKLSRAQGDDFLKAIPGIAISKPRERGHEREAWSGLT